MESNNEEIIEVKEKQCWVRNIDGITVRVMAVSGKYAMVRLSGCFPYVVSFSDLEKRYKLNPQIKKTKNINHGK